jgi:hypothetical protein
MRLVQVKAGEARRVGLVEEPNVRLIRGFDDGGFDSVYALAQAVITRKRKLSDTVNRHLTGELIEYDLLSRGDGKWRLLPPVDHPADEARCLVSGTGLTHLGSARDRDSMHLGPKKPPEQQKEEPKEQPEKDLTDSMKIFRWGVERGRPGPNAIGIAPEWFYKGTGSILKAPGEPLLVPPYAEDGGEEGEIAVAYLIGPDAQPYRIGMMPGNEFSDHRFEKKNYLNLAGSKLRTCSIGPELTIDAPFQSVPGKVTIERGGGVLWSQPIASGEDEMCHSLRNLEHHHFKFASHRHPGDVHIHFLGAHSLSFGHVEIQDGDIMEVQFRGFGRPLRNPVFVEPGPDSPVHVHALE